MKRIVLTGGPGAGKTVISQHLAGEHADRFVLVPEAATQVYGILQTRWDKLDPAGQRDVQRRIYHHQVEQEERFATADPGKILLLDRGTIDGAAYWPEGPDEYWRDLRSTLANELKRYDAVIWLQTAAAIQIYDGSDSNACRFEDADAAVASGEVLKTLWRDHPNFRAVDAHPLLRDKLDAARKTISEWLESWGTGRVPRNTDNSGLPHS